MHENVTKKEFFFYVDYCEVTSYIKIRVASTF